LYIHDQAIAQRPVDLPNDSLVYVSQYEGLWAAVKRDNHPTVRAAIDQFVIDVQSSTKKDSVRSPWAHLQDQNSDFVVLVVDKDAPLHFKNAKSGEIGTEHRAATTGAPDTKKKSFLETLSSFVAPMTKATAASETHAADTEEEGDSTGEQVAWWGRIAVGLLAIFVIGAVIVGVVRRLRVDSMAQNALKSVTRNVQGWVDQRLKDWQSKLSGNNKTS